MTIEANKSRDVYEGPYAVGESIGIPFKYLEKEYVKVATADEVLSSKNDYTVEGSNIILKREIPEGVSIVIYRQTPLDNNTSFPQEAEFDSEKINDAIDKLTMIVQEQQDALNRAVQIPNIVSPDAIGEGLTPSPEAGKALKWNAQGTFLVNTEYDVDAIGEKADAAVIAAQAASKAAQETIDTVKGYEASTYTRAVIDDKLANKQDNISVGDHLVKSDNLVYVDLDSIMLGMREYDWNQLTYEERRNIPLALIYEQ